MKSIISKLTINFSHSDVNEESQIIGPDKIITFKKMKLLIKRQWSLSFQISRCIFHIQMKMGNHKSLVETKSSHLRKITTVRRDLNEVYHFKTHDKFFTFRCKWGITNHWSRQNHHIQKKQLLIKRQWSLSFQISRCIFHIQMKMGNHKSLVETKSSHLRKITTVRRDLNEVYHFKTHDKFFTFRCKWGITNHWSRQNHHIQKKQLLIKRQWSLSFQISRCIFHIQMKMGIINHWSRQNHHI